MRIAGKPRKIHRGEEDAIDILLTRPHSARKVEKKFTLLKYSLPNNISWLRSCLSDRYDVELRFKNSINNKQG